MTITLVDELFRTQDFAENVTFYAVSGSGTGSVIPAIYDMTYQESTVGGMTYQNALPRVMVKTSDVPSVAVGSIIVVRGKTCSVMKPDPDDTGVTVLYLSEEAIQS